MKITTVQAILFTARWTEDPGFQAVPHSTAFLRIGTDEGISGVGETLLGYFVPEAVPPLVDFYRPQLIGQDPTAITALCQDLYDTSIWWGRTGPGLSVISGLEMALWDLRGKVLGVPVCDLLGGVHRAGVPVYASGGSSLWPPERTVEQVQFFQSKGYRGAKLSTGYYLEEDVSGAEGQRRMLEKVVPRAEVAASEADKMERLRRAMGADFNLALDGHQGGVPNPMSVKTALQICAAVEGAGLLLFEEPLPYEDVPGYAALRQHSHVPIAGGESLSGVAGFERFLEVDGLDIVQPDVGWVGGIQIAQKVLALAEARRLQAAIHTGGAVGPGLAASLHLAAASANVAVLERVVASTNVQDLLFKEPLQLVDGCLVVPRSPGLGIELREDVLAAHPYLPGSGERT